MAFGEYIQQLRKNKGLSLRELAALTNLSHSYLSQLENNKKQNPTSDIILRLSKHLGISYQALLEKAGKDVAKEYKLEINLTPHYHDNEDNPYFWVILQYTTNGWVNTGQCGWSKTPTEASVTALRSYNDLTVGEQY